MAIEAFKTSYLPAEFRKFVEERAPEVLKDGKLDAADLAALQALQAKLERDGVDRGSRPYLITLELLAAARGEVPATEIDQRLQLLLTMSPEEADKKAQAEARKGPSEAEVIAAATPREIEGLLRQPPEYLSPLSLKKVIAAIVQRSGDRGIDHTANGFSRWMKGERGDQPMSPQEVVYGLLNASKQSGAYTELAEWMRRPGAGGQASMLAQLEAFFAGDAQGKAGLEALLDQADRYAPLADPGAGSGAARPRVPRAAEDINTHKLHDLLDNKELRDWFNGKGARQPAPDLSRLKPADSMRLVDALLGHEVNLFGKKVGWVSPADLPDGGVFADNEERMIRDVLNAVPLHNVDNVAHLLIQPFESGGTRWDMIQETVNDPDYYKPIVNKFGPAIAAASLDQLTASSEVNMRVGTHAARGRDGANLASAALTHTYFPAGERPYKGFALAAKASSGKEANSPRLLLFKDKGPPEDLGELRLYRYSTPEAVRDAILKRFEEHVYGKSGMSAPEPWMNLARPYLDLDDPKTAQQRLLALNPKAGADLQRGMTVQRDEDGQIVGAVRRFSMPVEAFQRLLDPANKAGLSSNMAVRRALQQRLEKLGCSAKTVELVGNEDKGYSIHLGHEEARRLLEAEAFNRQMRQLSGKPDDGWEYLRQVGDRELFVMRPEEARLFDRVEPAEGETLAQALDRRVRSVGAGASVEQLTLDGQPVLALRPEHASKLMRLSRFDFNPTINDVAADAPIAIDGDNLRWGGRLSNLAYADYKNPQEIERTLRAWGVLKPAEKLQDRARLIAVGEAEVMVVKTDDAVFVVDRGTSSLADAAADATPWHGKKSQEILAKLSEKYGKELAFETHGAFLKEVGKTQGPVLEAVRALALADPAHPLPVWTAGHSKGGGQEQLRSVLLEEAGIHVSGSIPVEPARAGDDKFIQQAKTHGLDRRTVSVQMPADVVPHLPFHKKSIVPDLSRNHLGTIFMLDDYMGEPLWGLDAMQRFNLVKRAVLPGDILGQHMMTYVDDRLEQFAWGRYFSPPGDVPTHEPLQNK